MTSCNYPADARLIGMVKRVVTQWLNVRLPYLRSRVRTPAFKVVVVVVEASIPRAF